MNIVETEMDIYEIANNLFTNPNFNYKNCIIHNTDIKNYFEMLVLIVTEGLKYFFGENGKVNIDVLTTKDFLKIKEYLKKINIDMHYQYYLYEQWENNKLYKKYITYDKIVINKDTKLEELYFILKPQNSKIIYILNFYFIY